MIFDLVYVTYNSEKWINNCFTSIYKSNYRLSDINIYVVDNNSNDSTIEKLEKIKEEIGESFGSFNIIELKENLGFGKGNNLGFCKGKSNIVCFFNVDTELYPNTLYNLKNEIKNSAEEVALWELRQFPYEHPKFYSIITGYTSWSSGAAFAIKRNVYHQIKGFDENIFMYAEDVDLSWRLRTLGYKLKYVPKVTIKHYSYENANEVKPNQYFNSIINNLLLRYRFGSIKDITHGHFMLFKLMTHRGPFKHSRKKLLKAYLKHFFIAPKFALWRVKNKKVDKHFKPKFLGWDYEIIRDGAFYYNEYPKSTPLVSIIVRTCNRPNVLRETLISIKNQTYENIEIVVVEDGKNAAERMIKEEFDDLNIKYSYTGINVGRSKVGNIAMSLAKGKYLNFLDDDDLFFADHVEVLVKNIEDSEYRAAYSYAYETPTIVKSTEPYKYEEVCHNLVYRQKFNRIALFHHNYIPIQCIMFEKSMFEEYGGFDESLDALEDWDLWVRYALNNDFRSIGKATSIYRVPYDKGLKDKRQKVLDEALEIVFEKYKEYDSNMNPKQVSDEIQAILDTYGLKVSNEVLARIQKKSPFLIKLILNGKKLLKKLLNNR